MTEQGKADQDVSPEDDNRRLTPLDLRTYTGPLYVQHMNPVAQFIASSIDGKTILKLGPYGNENKSDVAMLPREVAESPSFQKSWRRGDVLVTTDPQMEEILLTADMEQLKQERARADEAAGLLTAPNEDKDLNLMACLECGANVWISDGELKKKPPLCPSHMHKYEQEPFRYVESQEMKDGKLARTWSKIG